MNHDATSRAGRVDRVGEIVCELHVSAGVVRSVEQHADARQPLAVGRFGTVEHTPFGQLGGWFETVTAEQHGVAQKSMELPEIGGTAVREIAMRLGRNADRHRRILHELGVRRLLTAQDDDRDPGGEHGVEPRSPAAGGTQDPHDDQG